jgi:D-alanine transaminase
MIVYFNGQYLAQDEVRISPTDRGFLFGDGVYEATASYQGRFLALDRHLARLQHGLDQLRISGLTAAELASAHHQLLERNQLASTWALVYVQVTRGAPARRTHAFPVPPVPPTVYAMANQVVPKYDAQKGVKAITVPDVRWSRCDLKTINLLPNTLANQAAQEAGAFEAIFVREGLALEGTHTGMFAVLDGEVRTSPANQYILPSVTRHLVLELCRNHAIRAREAAVSIEELRRADEIFLVGTTSEVLPVVDLDGHEIGGGKPGPISTRLQSLYRELTRTAS